MNTSVLLSIQGNKKDVVEVCEVLMKLVQGTNTDVVSINVANPVHRAGLQKLLVDGPKAYKLLKV